MPHALRHGGAPLPILCLLFTTVPHQGQNKDSRGQFPGSVVAIRAQIWRAKCPIIGHKGARLPTLCLLYITVLCPVMGKIKRTFRDKNIEEICHFPQRRGMFYFKNYSFYFINRKRALFGCGNFGEQAPPAPLIPPPLTVPLHAGAMRKVHGDNFPVPPSLYKGPIFYKLKG